MSLEMTKAINLDLLNPGTPRIIHAKQGERNTRVVKINLYKSDSPWTVPSGTTFEVAYCKPDGTGGKYSQIGTTAAVTASGNTLTVTLVAQALQCSGLVRCEVHMIASESEVLSTFTFFVSVQASAESGITSEDYWGSDKTDKVVMLTTEIGATANVATTHNVSAFVSTPRVGDAVVGSDGYVGKVTATSGTSVTIVSTGALWTDLSGAGNAVPLPTYNTPEVGSVVQVKELDASGKPKSWKYSAANDMASACFTNEADMPTTAGTAVELVGLAWYPRDPELGELVVGKNGYTGEVTAVDDENGPTVTATGNRIFTFAASDITYSGTVDGQAVADVNVALDALAAREQALVVRFTKQSSGTITADKTVAEIYAAHSSGKPVTGVYANSDYQLMSAETGGLYFTSWTGAVTYVLNGVASAGVDTWALERLDIKGTNVVLNGQIDGEEFSTVAGALALLAARGAKIEITLENGASPAITSVTKDGVSVGSTVAEWANAVHEAVQKGCPIAFVIGTSYYRPTNVNWGSSGTLLKYLEFDDISDLSRYFYIRVSLPFEGVPSVTIEDQM
mgnify:CR=1 FL=1